jgi:uncharacterized membrane-anchored protein YhcB (DUF1043 family)
MDKDLEYFQNAIEASPEELEQHLLETGELLTPEDYNIIYQYESMLDAMCHYEGC